MAGVAGTFTTNDGVKLGYTAYGSEDAPVLVMIHGWSGSQRYFDLNVKGLSERLRVYTVNLRGHGVSEMPAWGLHIARLAADLRDFLDALSLSKVALLGTSMGAAVIWSYIELFGESRISKAIFVDQSPLQNRAPDWDLGSRGCYNEATLAALRTNLVQDLRKEAEGTIQGCLHKHPSKEFEETLLEETLRCKPQVLGALMADHTQLDWRPLLPRIKVPCLNLVGRKSQVFPWQGPAVIGDLIPTCRTTFFEDCDHWLYMEEPERFNKEVIDFLSS